MVDINRINELARKKKTVGLTEDEIKEQAMLRRAYIDSVTGNLRSQLDSTYILEKDGTKTKVVSKNSTKH